MCCFPSSNECQIECSWQISTYPIISRVQGTEECHKSRVILFVLPHFNFCLTVEKSFYVFILFPAVEECYYVFILLKMFIKNAKRL